MKHADSFFFTLSGKCSEFGGPHDTGMGPHEGVALYQAGSADPYKLFLPGSGRLGHDLNPAARYIAVRWMYSHHEPDVLRNTLLRVESVKTGKVEFARPVDWGPNKDTDRVADLSPGVIAYLGEETDGEVLVSGLWVP